jgi:hypothetical protein
MILVVPFASLNNTSATNEGEYVILDPARAGHVHYGVQLTNIDLGPDHVSVQVTERVRVTTCRRTCPSSWAVTC